jgi:Fungal protein kinase
MLDIIQRYHLDLEIDAAEFLQDSRWIVASCSPPSESHDSSLPRGRTRCFAFGRALSQSTNLFSRATVVWRVVVEGHEEKLFALKDSWRELCRKPEVFFYERIRKYKGESAWVGLASFIGSLDLGEEGEESSHHTCSATLRVGEHSDQHTCSHMRTLTYSVGRKLMTFTSTKQLVVALRAAIEGLVFCF